MILIGSCRISDDAGTGLLVSAPVPFDLDHNRLFADVEFETPDGGRRTARAWIDTGNQFLIVTEDLAVDLGLDVSGFDQNDPGRPIKSASTAPTIFLGGFPLSVDGVDVEIARASGIWTAVPAEINLPASVLRDLHVIFDYPERRLTVARSGQLEPRGFEVPCRVNPETGLFQVAMTIDGETVELGVDTGSAGTWVSENLTRSFQEKHPDWPHATGAVGPANFFGFDFELTGTLMKLPEILIGDARVTDSAVLGIDQGIFDWYAMKSAGPVVGILGANVLRKFRLEVDYPHHMTYWEPGLTVGSADLDIVGLTLRPEVDGSYLIAGIVRQNGELTAQGVEPGDVLRRVGSLEADGATMGTVIEALRGMPGELRLLVIERDGERIEVEATVTRFP